MTRSHYCPICDNGSDDDQNIYDRRTGRCKECGRRRGGRAPTHAPRESVDEQRTRWVHEQFPWWDEVLIPGLAEKAREWPADWADQAKYRVRLRDMVHELLEGMGFEELRAACYVPHAMACVSCWPKYLDGHLDVTRITTPPGFFAGLVPGADDLKFIPVFRAVSQNLSAPRGNEWVRLGHWNADVKGELRRWITEWQPIPPAGPLMKGRGRPRRKP